MQEISIPELEEKLSNSEKTLVEFGATWCSPCKAILPILNEIASGDQGIDVLKIDIDKEEKTALEAFGIRSVPTIIAFENGKAVNRTVGMQSKKNLLSMFS